MHSRTEIREFMIDKIQHLKDPEDTTCDLFREFLKLEEPWALGRIPLERMQKVGNVPLAHFGYIGDIGVRLHYESEDFVEMMSKLLEDYRKGIRNT